jgi:NADH:ubiquinone oxidoreductase subunit 3 (subunit A)
MFFLNSSLRKMSSAKDKIKILLNDSISPYKCGKNKTIKPLKIIQKPSSNFNTKFFILIMLYISFLLIASFNR